MAGRSSKRVILSQRRSISEVVKTVQIPTPSRSTSGTIARMTDAEGETSSAYVPVTYERCDHIEGPFFHGTKSVLTVHEELLPGYGSNYREDRASNNIYFTALVDTAAWGAELATALAGNGERGHIYVVKPTGPFEDDPNVTNKKFPGNITQSYRTCHPLLVVSEVENWEGHSPEVLRGMLDRLALLREQGLDVIED